MGIHLRKLVFGALVLFGCRTEVPAEKVDPADRSAAELDSLVAALDSAGGFFYKLSNEQGLTQAELNRQAFQRHGQAGVVRLVRCMGDTQPTTTALDLEGDDGEVVSRGTLCYEALSSLIRTEWERAPAGVTFEDLYPASPARDDNLERARNAWRKVVEADAYSWVLPLK